MSRRAAVVLAFVVAVAALVAGGAAFVVLRELAGDDAADDHAGPSSRAPTAELVARGAYLARAGNCAACHTARGGLPYAGGRGIETPFGTVYASNLTSDRETGIGAWTPAQFWRALHLGRSADGRLLYPAFPYPNYTRVTRADADALHAFLRSVAPVSRPNRHHDLRFPFDRQAALAVWRVLYFRPGAHRADATRSAEWNRGAYLVEGLGHCSACHASRNALGATTSPLDFNGGLIPVQNWYAPSLRSPDEAGLAGWQVDDVMALLGTGVAKNASVLGPMAEVVGRSTQYLDAGDLRAVAVFLKSLPQVAPHAPARRGAPSAATAPGRGADLYDGHCARCHGERGEGVPGIYAALAGNRAVTLETPANLVHVVLSGGFPPSTAGHPRPFGMPPFGTELNDADIADVLTHIRASWGNAAPAVSEFDVQRYRRRGP